MIGCHHVNRTIADATPQFVLLAYVTQRWAKNELHAIFCIVTAFVQQEILWAGFNPDWLVIRTGKTQIIQT